MRLPDSVAQPITRLLRVWPVKFQRPVEQDDVGRERLQFTALPVIGAVRGCDEQTEHQRGHGGDQAHHELHDIPGIRVQMMVWQFDVQDHSDEGGAEGTAQNDRGDSERAHRGTTVSSAFRCQDLGTPL